MSRPDDDPVPPGILLSLEEALRVWEALEDSRLAMCDAGLAPGLQDELATVIRIINGRLGLEGRRAVTDPDVLLPAEAARRLGVPTRLIVEAMYEKKLPRVRLEDGTLGIPADALDDFQVPTG